MTTLRNLIRRPRSKELLLFIIFSGLLIIALGFNNCSGVKFEKANESEAGVNGTGGEPPGGDPGDPVCYGNTCPPENPTTPVAYSESFTALPRTGKVDVLLVVDNSGSMETETAELAQRLDGFVQNLQTSGADWRLCYTSTWIDQNPRAGKAGDWVANVSIVSGGGGGTMYTYTPLATKYIDVNTPNRVQVFTDTMTYFPIGAGSGTKNEQGLTAIRRIVNDSSSSTCFRSDAALATIILADEDQRSCGGRCKDGVADSSAAKFDARTYRDQYSALVTEDNPDYLVDLLKDKWPTKPYTHHSIVVKENDTACYKKNEDQGNPAFFGIEYSKVSKRTGGVIGNICAANYASQLTDISVRINDSLDSVSLKCSPVASPAPKVLITSAAGANITANYMITVDGNKIFFKPSLVAGTKIKVDYTCLK